MECDGLVEGGDEFIGERGDVWKGERKRNSESMWRVKGSANGRYVKDEERGKEDQYCIMSRPSTEQFSYTV